MNFYQLLTICRFNHRTKCLKSRLKAEWEQWRISAAFLSFNARFFLSLRRTLWNMTCFFGFFFDKNQKSSTFNVPISCVVVGRSPWLSTISPRSAWRSAEGVHSSRARVTSKTSPEVVRQPVAPPRGYGLCRQRALDSVLQQRPMATQIQRR